MRGLLALLVLSISGSSFAQDPKPGQAHPKVDQSKVDAAIDRGAAYLLSNGVGRTFSHNHAKDLSDDDLVFYTLIHAGVDYNHETFKKLLEQAEKAPLRLTYRVVLTAMALETLDRGKHQNRIADCAQFLADNQAANGQWFYGEETKLPEREKPKPEKQDTPTGPGANDKPPPKPSGGTRPLPKIRITQKRPGPATGDNSNSQYAALGIRACVNAGIEFDPKIIVKAVEWWEKCHHKQGGWPYCFQGQYTHDNFTVTGDDPYGSMTAGGLGSMCIYRWLLRQDYKRDKCVVNAMNWMSSNLKFNENPRHKDPGQWLYYWIYAVERAGMLYGTEKFGTHEWYPEGANWLLKEQKGDGSWCGKDNNSVEDTCFAILFLRRATKPLPKVATGK